MAYVSAAEYAASEPAKKAYSDAMAYQAANPSTSSSKPQANDPGSAAYIPSATSTAQVGGSGGMRNGISTTAYSDQATYNWNKMTPDQQKTWDTAGRNWDDLRSADYLTRINTPTPQSNAVSTPGMMSASKLGGNQQTPAVTPMAYSPNMGNNYGMGSLEQSQFGYPAMPQMSNGTASNAFPVKTPDQIKAEAQARTDALLAKQTTIAGQTKQGFQTSFDRLAATTKDDRTLQNAAFQRNTNPFSGGTDYQKDMTGRQREISDQQSREDLQTRLANVDLSLADYANATDAQRMQMETDMTNAERSYGLQVDQLALQTQGQALGQFNADRSFNYGVGQDQIKNGQWSQTFNQNQSNADRTFNAGRQDVTYNQGQDQIKNNAVYNGIYNPSGLTLNQVNDKMAANSAAWGKASPAEQQRLHDENLYLASLKGSNYNPVTGEYSQGNNYVGNKTQDALKNEFNQATTLNELKFKQDSYKQTFDENVRQFDVKTALDNAYKQGQLTVDQYNSATSRMNANTSASNATSSASSKLTDQLLETWKASGTAPSGLERLGVQPGQAYNDGKASQVKVADVIDQLNKSTFVTPSYQGERPTTYDPVGLAKSILSRGMTKQENDYLFSYYNIDTKSVLEQLNKSGN